MGTTVQEVKGVKYSDGSGIFREGMKKEDVKMSIFERILYMTSPKSGFDKIDKDRDGILSHDEISDEIKSDISDHKTAMTALSISGLLDLGFSYVQRNTSPKSSKLWLGVAVLTTLAAGCSLVKSNKLEQRLANGYN